MFRKTKRHFFGKLDYNVNSENKTFWTTAVSHFLEKDFHKEFIILNTNAKVISNNDELEEIFNNHFSELVENLDIDKTPTSSISSSDHTDLIFDETKKYEYHLNGIIKVNILRAVKI